MWHIQPVDYENADGLLRELYQQDLDKNGYVDNTTVAWSYRPEVMVLWTQLIKAIRSNLRLRTYELITLAAARSMGCKY